MSVDKIIQVKNATVKYKNFTAVDDISFEVKSGEIFGIIGPNGAGKTSIIECLEGLRNVSGGSVSVLGINPSDRRRLHKHIGVQLQEANFPDNIRVEELCRLFSSFYNNPADYNTLLKRFSLDDKRKMPVKKLSGGQRQKISIITALIANPSILFLDELTTGLDPQSRIDMWELVASLRDEGKTIIMTTHFMDEAEYLCDRVCMMMNGKIISMGTIEELISNAEIDMKITFNSPESADIISGLTRLAGVGSAQMRGGTITVYGNGKDFLKDVVLYLNSYGLEPGDLSFKKPGLEEIFLKLTGNNTEVRA